MANEAGGQAGAKDLADRICLDVAELPDRTSPDDWPEAMLVTGEELHAIVLDALEALAVPPTPAIDQAGAVRQRMHDAIVELVEVARLRGDNHVPQPWDDVKLWSARMADAWSEIEDIADSNFSTGKPLSEAHRTALQYLYDSVDDGLPEEGAVYSQETVVDAMEGYAALIQQCNAALYGLSSPSSALAKPTEPASEGVGYAAAFYEIADLLGISARADSPANVWRNEMRPRLQAALATESATANSGAPEGMVLVSEVELRELRQRMPWAGGQSPLVCGSSGFIAAAPLADKEHHAVPNGAPPEPVSNPSEEWCDLYAAWYEGQPR